MSAPKQRAEYILICLTSLEYKPTDADPYRRNYLILLEIDSNASKASVAKIPPAAKVAQAP
jgi:hypothetical protein